MVFDVYVLKVYEIELGNVLVVKYNGKIINKFFIEKCKCVVCFFECIYFLRGIDWDIYLECKKLGEFLIKDVLDVVDYNYDWIVFFFVFNIVEIVFFGLMEGIEKVLNCYKKEKIFV